MMQMLLPQGRMVEIVVIAEMEKLERIMQL